MKKIGLIVLTITIITQTGYTQNRIETKGDFPILKGEYLGQKPPGIIPEIFAPGIVSLEENWEAAISFSPDGKECFFTRRQSIQGYENRIMYMEIKDSIWTQPRLAPFAKDIIEYEAFVSPDGKFIYYNSDRSKPDIANAIGEIWYSKKN